MDTGKSEAIIKCLIDVAFVVMVWHGLIGPPPRVEKVTPKSEPIVVADLSVENQLISAAPVHVLNCTNSRRQRTT